MPRRFPIFQFPNRPLIVAALAGVAQRLVGRRYAPVARLVHYVALLVWALEEVGSGVNWFRRLLGVGGTGYSIDRLLQAGRERRRPRPGVTARSR